MALVLVASAALLSVSWVDPAVEATGRADHPVLFVHGYEAWGCPSANGPVTFAPMIDFLRRRGWSQPMVTVGYYACDVEMTADLPAGGGVLALDRDTDLRVLAQRLAWLIWDDWSSHGEAIDVVGHSMGGLIVRWMLYRVQAHASGYPPRLDVRAVVTIATPHAGAPFAAFCPTTQCREMAPGSPFLAELAHEGSDPRGSGGTSWSLIGSTTDQVVPADSAVAMGAAHRIVYAYPGYGHNDYLYDDATAADAHVTYANPGDTGWHSSPAGLHPLDWLAQALETAG